MKTHKTPGFEYRFPWGSTYAAEYRAFGSAKGTWCATKADRDNPEWSLTHRATGLAALRSPRLADLRAIARRLHQFRSAVYGWQFKLPEYFDAAGGNRALAAAVYTICEAPSTAAERAIASRFPIGARNALQDASTSKDGRAAGHSAACIIQAWIADPHPLYAGLRERTTY